MSAASLNGMPTPVIADAPIGFRVPVALDHNGHLTTREDATKGRRYRCPACHSGLIFKAGPIRARHFAHAPSFECHPETVVHETAKRLIAQVVADWRSGNGPQPTVEKRCQECMGTGQEHLRGQVEVAAVEHRLADGLIADVALLRRDAVLGVVEILVTHAVDSDKAERLVVPWVELRGEDVLDDPLRWKPVAFGNLRRFVCDPCQNKRRAAIELCRSLGVDFDDSVYEPGIISCYRCRKKTPVFAWRPGQLHEAERPPDPLPRTVEHRYSKLLGRRYWANTCFHCHALFGDWFLFAEPDGPFFGRPDLQYRGDEEEEEEDLDLEPPAAPAPRPRPVAAPPISPYDVHVVRCRECRAENRYFSWDGDEPPQPRPDTLRLIGGAPSRAAPPGLLPVTLPASADQWENFCLHCDASLER